MDERVVVESERGVDRPGGSKRPISYDANRERHTIEESAADLDFTHAQFSAMIQPGTVKYNKAGDIEMTLVIPVKERHMFGVLGAAMRKPLLVTLEPWRNREVD